MIASPPNTRHSTAVTAQLTRRAANAAVHFLGQFKVIPKEDRPEHGDLTINTSCYWRIQTSARYAEDASSL